MKIWANSVMLLAFLVSTLGFGQETYTIGNTDYYFGEYYSTTGKPMVKRSEANKRTFLKSIGYNQVPEGYEVDHIKPLSQGGTDDPSNMQLLSVSEHRHKTARERAISGNSTYSTSLNKFTSNRTVEQINNYNYNSTSSTYSHLDSKGRAIYKGNRGGEYYFSSSGRRVYVNRTSKNNTSSSYFSTPTPASPIYNAPINSSRRTIHTGSRGGKYYINSNGNKTYIKSNN